MSVGLGDQPWLAAPSTAAVFDALEAAGGADCARFVGGCVRNALIGQPVNDIDIATRLTPEQVIGALKAAKLRAVPTGVDHGTVTAIAGGRPYEITTLRRDLATDGRRAVVAFTDDWDEDARRRDFTLNALYAHRDGSVVDPTGMGVADANAGRIVFVGPPAERIGEDHLRILRFFRFLAWYGRGEPDAAGLQACAAMKDQIGVLSAERVRGELLKLLAAPDPRAAVALMAQSGVLAVVLGRPGDLARLARLAADADSDSVLRLAALLPDDPAVALATAQHLRLSNAERDRLVAALTPAPGIAPGMDDKSARAALYRLGAAAFRDRVRLADAGAPLLQLAARWTPPVFPLTGADVMQAGAPQGPAVGRILRRVEDWWIAQDFTADRAALLATLGSQILARDVEEGRSPL